MRVRSRSRSLAPDTVDSLRTCVDEKTCLLVKEGGFAHVRVELALCCLDVREREVVQDSERPHLRRDSMLPYAVARAVWVVFDDYGVDTLY